MLSHFFKSIHRKVENVKSNTNEMAKKAFRNTIRIRRKKWKEGGSVDRIMRLLMDRN